MRCSAWIRPACNDLRSQTGGGTMLYDAMCESFPGNHADADRPQGAHRAHRRRGHRAAQATIADAIEAAQRADTLIYSILFSDEGYYGIFSGGADGRNVLMRMSRDTGGGFFEVSKKQSLDDIFTQTSGGVAQPV